MKTFLCITVYTSLFFFSTLVPSVYAVEVSFETEQPIVGVGQVFEVNVYVDSEGDKLNAFEGVIEVPSFLEIKKIDDGNSLISLWSDRPSITNEGISFQGIIPGGWSGGKRYLFSFVAEAVDTGTSVWNISDLSVLLHDGKGTPAHTRIVNHSIIVEEKITINEELYVSVQDVEPPEKFTLYIDRSPEIFDNATFVVFSAQDKNSGIDYYEILESKRKIQNYDSDVWNAAQSPYLLEDQLLESYIYVRAVDRAGNTRLAVHTPDHGKSISISIILYALYALLFVYVLMYFIRRKKDK